ncbi:MAG: hypothetical protein AAF317_13730 [Pseudomonadota bacterium]
MASLDRAYGIRGAVIAIGVAGVAGLIHGTLASQVVWLAPKIALLVMSVAAIVIGGTVSARQGYATAMLIAVTMSIAFFCFRWTGFSIMADAGTFLTIAPWNWPDYIATTGVSWLWTIETGLISFAALLGCLAGHERSG